MTESRRFARRCAGCMAEQPSAGPCQICHWDDASQPDVHNHMPRHYVLFNRYYIGRVLGKGGFGITYLAFDETLHRRVAIKEYFPSSLCSRLTNRITIHSAEGELRDHYLYGLTRFLEEARMLARFENHPCIVPVSEFLEANGTAYLVMAYLEGVSLKDYLAQQLGGRIPWDLAVETLMPVMEALQEVHMHGLLHRDISPDNIFVTGRRQIKLLDFGAARHAVNERSQSLTVILKPGYAPEEQYRSNGRQGPWTDVYALSATLYRCITGQTPQPAIDRLHDDKVTPPSSLCPGITPVQDQTVLTGMALKAEARYSSVAEFQSALMGGSGQKPHPVPPVEPPPFPAVTPQPPKPRFPIYQLIGFSALALILVVVLILVAGGNHHPQASGSTAPPPPPPPSLTDQSQTAGGTANMPNPPPQQDDPSKTYEGRTEPNQLSDSDGNWSEVETAFDTEAQKWPDQIATIYLQNRCPQTPIRVALHFKSPANDRWVTLGWRNVPSGETLNTHFITKTSTVYVYAEGKSGQIWNGDDDPNAIEQPVVADEVFAHKEGTPLEGEGQRVIKMFSNTISSTGPYTVSFTCPNN